jgi:putative tricarboxylic transport membrane protein
MDSIGYFFMTWTDPQLLFIVAAGTFAGIYIGAIPGLSVTMAASILISFTFTWHVNEALALIAGVFLGGVYGGARTAILLNIPGAPSAVATALDGYPLAQRGEAGTAIGIGTVMSVIGGFVGIIALAVAAPVISQFALLVAPRDYLLIAIIGILLVGSLASASLAKGIFAAALGVVIGLVGMDPMTAQPRFTFGQFELLSGISYVAAMIGFFGIAEVLYQMRSFDLPAVKQKVGRIIPEWSLIRRMLPLTFRSSSIGVTIGALPGTGGDIASLLAYDQAKRSVKNPSRPFGKGAYEGVVAPEAANNAAVGGAYVPMLTLGIPGDAVTAIIIGALYIHGLRPGPLLMVDTPHIFWFTVGSLTLANIFLLIFGLGGVRLFSKLVELPKGIILPMIVVLAVVGTFAVQNSITDVYWMLAFGIVGYFLKVYGFPVAPVILGIILGPLMDASYRRAMISAREDIGRFLMEFITAPISLILTIGFILLVLGQTPLWSRIVRRRRAGAP